MRPRQSLLFDAGETEAMRKVNALYRFHRPVQPTNMEAVGLRFDGQGKLRPGQHAVVVNAKDRQALHRYLSLGTGFYPWMARLPETKKSDDWLGQLSLAKDMRPLPTTNFLDFGDATLANAIVEEALPQDRARFRRYLTDRPLGLGLVAAVSGLNSYPDFE